MLNDTDRGIPARRVDINGDIITTPPGYNHALEAIHTMIESMDKNNVDRSDMMVVVEALFFEARFNWTFLPPRTKPPILPENPRFKME